MSILRQLLKLVAPLICASTTNYAGATATHPAVKRPHTLIVDGFWGLHDCWEPLRSQIDHQVGPCQIWRYDNSGRVSLEEIGARLAEELRKPNGPRQLIGFSMGGLVVREAMRQAPEVPIEKAILLNSPNAGSYIAWLLPLHACREMRPGSAFLQRLNAASWKTDTMVTWCPGDLMVLPGSSGRWPKADVILRSDVPAHAWPIVGPDIHRAVIRFLLTARKDEARFKPKVL